LYVGLETARCCLCGAFQQALLLRPASDLTVATTVSLRLNGTRQRGTIGLARGPLLLKQHQIRAELRGRHAIRGGFGHLSRGAIATHRLTTDVQIVGDLKDVHPLLGTFLDGLEPLCSFLAPSLACGACPRRGALREQHKARLWLVSVGSWFGETGELGSLSLKHSLDSFTKIGQQMPAVSDLNSGGRPFRRAVRELSGAVTGDDLHPRMLLEPGGYGLGATVREEVDWRSAFNIDQDGAIDPPFLQGKLVNSQHARRWCFSLLVAPKHAHNGIRAGTYPQPMRK